MKMKMREIDMMVERMIRRENNNNDKVMEVKDTGETEKVMESVMYNYCLVLKDLMKS